MVFPYFVFLLSGAEMKQMTYEMNFERITQQKENKRMCVLWALKMSTEKSLH